MIGYIKNESQLQADLLRQIKDLFFDQTSITAFANALEDFLAKVNLGGGDEEADAEEEAKEETAEPESEEVPIEDSNLFVID